MALKREVGDMKSLFSFRRVALSEEAGEPTSPHKTVDVVNHLDALRSIFSFKGGGASDDQTESTVVRMSSLFKLFCQLHTSREGVHKAETPVLDFCVERLTPRLDLNGGVVHWYPRYGAVLLQFGTDNGTSMRQLHLVGLDQWAFDVHRGSLGHEHTAHSNNYSLLNVGGIRTEDYDEFLQIVAELLDLSQSRASNDKGTRNAAHSQHSHQWTPSFLQAVMKRTLETLRLAKKPDAADLTADLLKSLPIKGGFTDVGLHTGGRCRNTAWPIFQAAVLVLMEQCQTETVIDRRVFFMDTMCNFELFLTEDMISSTGCNLATGTAGQIVIDQCMSMLKQVSYLGAGVADLGRDMSTFVERCIACRVELERLRDKNGERMASTFELSEHDMQVECFAQHSKLPNIEIAGLHSGAQAGNYEAMCLAVCKNIGWIGIPVVQAASTLVELNEGGGNTFDREQLLKIQFRLRVMERSLFTWFLLFAQDDPDHCLAHVSADDLRRLATQYREALKTFSSCPESLHHMQSELRSRETLFVWVLHCFVHAQCARMEVHGPLVREFGVALRWSDLNHLVLSDKLSRDTCLAVCTYLRRNYRAGKELFHLGQQDSTFNFAFRVSKQDQNILRIWRSEQCNQMSRVDAHWNEVVRKQQLAKRLRDELVILREKEAKQARDLRTEQEEQEARERRWISKGRVGKRPVDTDLEDARTRHSVAVRNVQAKEREVKEAEKAPPALIENLPPASNERLALQVLFFMHMPELLRDLSEITILAQELLLPPALVHKQSNLPDVHPCREWDLTQKLQVIGEGLKNSWLECFNAAHNYFPRGPDVKGTVGSIALQTAENAPREYGPGHVDDFRTKMCGVWYPSDHRLKMGWSKGGMWMNPFEGVPETVRVMCHTENLATHSRQPGVEKLQWAMDQLCDSNGKHPAASRGNWALVLQDLRPAWLTKQEFLEFGSMRAYPLQQLRRMCIAIKSRSLPFSNTAVHVLLKQVLFHLGDAQDCAGGLDTTLLWKRELCHGANNHVDGNFLSTLLSEMTGLANELKEKPREHTAVLLLGEMASHLAEYHMPFRAVAWECRQISQDMASRNDKELETHSSDPTLARTFRRKRKLLQLHAIMSYSSSSQLDAAGALDVVTLLAMAQNGDVVDDGKTTDDIEIERLMTLARNVVAFNLPAILSAILDDPGILTTALRAVVQSAPHELEWVAFDVKDSSIVRAHQSSCFYARHANDLYALNFLSGQILFNGNPIRGLPLSVLSHPLYCRCFGKSNFEVKEHGQGSHFVNSFETSRYIKGRYLYKFSIAADGAIVVEEFDSTLQQTLELLDGVAPTSWGRELPERLLHMHSHWISRETGTLVFRPIDYRKHAVQFLGLMRERGANSEVTMGDAPEGSVCQVYEIPLHRQEHEWTSLKQPSVQCQLEHLVLCPPESQLLLTLSKFEDPAFIHVLSSHDEKSVRFNFPRYKLDLVLTEDAFTCKTYSEYDVETCQQLSDTMFGFSSYLLLRLQNPDDDVEGRSKQLVLVPRGKISAVNHCSHYVVKSSERCDAELMFFAYEVQHRFLQLQAANVDARLYLAAIYAATSSELPEKRLEMTGVEHAAVLVRQSWTNEPLTALELESLQQVADWSYSSPTLSLLCHHLMESSQSLAFLYPGEERRSITLPMNLTPDELRTCYYQEHKGSPGHVRRALTPDEEQSIMGVSGVTYTRWQRGCLTSVTALDESQRELNRCEDELQYLVQIGKLDTRAQKQIKRCIAHVRTLCLGAIGTQMVDELETSCAVGFQQPVRGMSDSLETVQSTAKQLLSFVVEKRASAEQQLLSLINDVPDSSNMMASITRFRLMQAANELPLAALSDVAQFAVVDGLAEQFNPLLDRDTVHGLQSRSLVWLQWCTLEDRLESIAAHTALALRHPTLIFNREAALQEIQTRRTWNVQDNPEWLLFEVEGRIRIRPRQLEVARQLLENPGSIVQLNMGEGKTRVILPMIWLHLSRSRDAVVRAHFLTTLLSEAKEYMQRRVSASLLCRRVYLMPFNRDIELSEGHLRRMSAVLASCQRNRGMLMLAPEHRLSLHLKCRESQQGAGAEVAGLRNVMEQFRMHDIFDESDVLLHHNYQLVYALGVGSLLPSGASRWNAAQALLRALAHHPTLLTELTASRVVTVKRESPSTPAFPRLQLNEGDQLAAALPKILRELGWTVLTNPPHELKWMLLAQDSSHKKALLSCMVEKGADARKILNKLGIPASQQEDILAFRGFLAHGVLEHCLKKRFRVEYGLKRSGRKHLAVPYLASDTPSERSEFQHSDCQILLTILSHYYDGLTQNQIKRAVEVLLQLGLNARNASYSRWLEAGVDIDEAARIALDSVDKLDLSNTKLLQQASQAFTRNPETINFYLNNCVLPQETTHYPHTLRSSAWDLADNEAGSNRGFSGTNDLHMLLPQQVRQLFSDDPALSGTNGKMVHLLLQNTTFLTLRDTEAQPPPSPDMSCRTATVDPSGLEVASKSAQWGRVLSLCIERAVDALIDAGGLMAGVNNQQVAQTLVVSPLFPEKFRGVTFFCVHSKSWKVLDRDGSCQPKHSSPIRTQNTFAFFDESRCRGADLKLRQDASAMLTVGEKMCKDKMMQAAGRMRQLAAGQSLLFVGTHNVADRIAELQNSDKTREETRSLSSEDLLCWVMQNTVKAAVDGLMMWADKGSAFYTTKHTPQHAVFDEVADLDTLYAQKRAPLPAATIITKLQKVYLARMQAGIRGRDEDLESENSDEGPQVTDLVTPCLSQILAQVTKMAAEVVIERSALEEECEREVEQEEEQEEEVERQVARAVPNSEIDWDYTSLLLAQRATSVAKTVRHLPDLLQPLRAEALPKSLESGGVSWSKTVYCTDNFWFTLVSGARASVTADYLRPVDVAWQFPSGELLLLSEREADFVLRLLWTKTARESGCLGQLRHLGYLRDDKDIMKMLLDGREREEERRNVKTTSSVCLQLLNGDTTYPGQHRKEALQAMVAGEHAELEASWMVQARGKHANYPYSDLENIKYAQVESQASTR